ncbi:TetR/AcrR family transcriptional regulator [Pantoea sp. B65]|uniref:TetR/AcrR family transcriptional regulator n=1 Tax=Pantoea sp. B65 TaxID=2813359 RepID=UPI0039B57187
MNHETDPSGPRKAPVQARSIATVDAILDAAIQVLLKQGLARCNTTRVAERAGVSIGSLYQYFPNREAMMVAVLARYLATVASQLEQACAAAHYQPVDRMAQALVLSWLEAKLSQPALSRALYAVAESYGSHPRVRAAQERLQAAVRQMLNTASDGKISPLPVVTVMLLGAINGPVRMLLEGSIDPAQIEVFRQHLIVLASAYLHSVLTRSSE